MNRRNIFKTILAAIFGRKIIQEAPKPLSPLDKMFAADAARMMGEIDKRHERSNRMSQLISKGPLPENMGYQFSIHRNV